MVSLLFPIIAYFKTYEAAVLLTHDFDTGSLKAKATMSRVTFVHPEFPNLPFVTNSDRFPTKKMNQPFPQIIAYMQVRLFDEVHQTGPNLVYGWTLFTIKESSNGALVWSFPTISPMSAIYGKFTIVAAHHSGSIEDANQQVFLVWGMKHLRPISAQFVPLHLSTYHFIKKQNCHFRTFFNDQKPVTQTPVSTNQARLLAQDLYRNVGCHQHNFLLHTFNQIIQLGLDQNTALNHLIEMTESWFKTTTCNIDPLTHIRYPMDVILSESMLDLAISWKRKANDAINPVPLNSLRERNPLAPPQPQDNLGPPDDNEQQPEPDADLQEAAPPAATPDGTPGQSDFSDLFDNEEAATSPVSGDATPPVSPAADLTPLTPEDDFSYDTDFSPATARAIAHINVPAAGPIIPDFSNIFSPASDIWDGGDVAYLSPDNDDLRKLLAPLSPE